MRIHADPVSTALLHPTRRALYLALLSADEHTTVELQKLVAVNRYNLYHHLNKLANLGLIMNHRDEGRARWWCVLNRVPLPTDGNAATDDDTMLSIPLQDARVQAQARRLLRELAEISGQSVDLDAFTLESLQIKGRPMKTERDK